MQRELRLLWLLLISLLAVHFFLRSPSHQRGRRRRCPVSGKEALYEARLKHRGSCFRVGVCSRECYGKLIKDARDEETFTQAYGILNGFMEGQAGIYIRDPQTGQLVQFLHEVLCGP